MLSRSWPITSMVPPGATAAAAARKTGAKTADGSCRYATRTRS
ncbi:MAG TPA: hypothetical protein VKV35_09605 [Streptosporangiaceae bacterium]|nr:hypothetical protein [Streptosporangiaceae bacterium]